MTKKAAPRRSAPAPTPRSPRQAAGPANESRAAGQAAPESAASERVPASFYSPAGDSQESADPRVSANASALGAGFETDHAQHHRFAQDVREQAVGEGDITADFSLARQALADEAPDEDALADVLAADIARIKEMRRPLGTHSQKLYLPVRPGYKRHWFNDEGGRIDDALSNGWASVKDRDRKPYRRAVGRGRDQGVLYAYAMEIPEVFWQEDMAARHKIAAEKVDALKAAPVRSRRGQSARSDQGKFYSPVEGEEIIEVETH